MQWFSAVVTHKSAYIGQIPTRRWGDGPPARPTLAGKWRGWSRRGGRGQRRGRGWWSLQRHLIGRFGGSASKAWLRHPPECQGCRRAAKEAKDKWKGQICKKKKKRWISYWLEDKHMELVWLWSSYSMILHFLYLFITYLKPNTMRNYPC